MYQCYSLQVINYNYDYLIIQPITIMITLIFLYAITISLNYYRCTAHGIFRMVHYIEISKISWGMLCLVAESLSADSLGQSADLTWGLTAE